MKLQKDDGLIRGRVISHVGKGLVVQSEKDEQVLLCHPRRKLEKIAVGDYVSCQQEDETQGVIVEIHTRRSLLARPGRQGRSRPVAANLDQVLVVIAAKPECDFLLVDQYLAYCEIHALRPKLILNKCDMEIPTWIESQLSYLIRLDYELLRVSARNDTGIEKLKEEMAGKTSILVGQSGVGKSSISRQLIDTTDTDLRVNSISETTGHGRHTTTATTLYPLKDTPNSFLIDSPGVAIFGLDNFTPKTLTQGYRELAALEPFCQFNDCNHEKDRGCAIIEAVSNGQVCSDRYDRYLKLKTKLPKNLKG